jgi:hypothetical protein
MDGDGMRHDVLPRIPGGSTAVSRPPAPDTGSLPVMEVNLARLCLFRNELSGTDSQEQSGFERERFVRG